LEALDYWNSDVVANTDISITVMHVRNPMAGVTSNFKVVGHTEKNGSWQRPPQMVSM
jgi:hypothetical protein